MVYLVTFVAFLMGLLFLLTAIDKLSHWKEHIHAIDDYQIIRSSLTTLFLVLFTTGELIVSISLLVVGPLFFNISIGILLLVVYSVAVAINLRRGNTQLSCGCGSVLENGQLSGSLIIRNVLLIAISAFMLIFNQFSLQSLNLFERIPVFLLSLSTLLIYGIIQHVLKDIKILKTILYKFQ